MDPSNNPLVDEIQKGVGALSPDARAVAARLMGNGAPQPPAPLAPTPIRTGTPPTLQQAPRAFNPASLTPIQPAPHIPALAQPPQQAPSLGGMTPIGHGAPNVPVTLPPPGPKPPSPQETEANRLENSPSGIEGKADAIHNPFLRTLAKVGGTAADVIASGLFPRFGAFIPGTTAHHELLTANAEHEANQEKGREQADAKQVETQAQTANIASLPELHEAQLENTVTKQELASDLANRKLEEAGTHHQAQTEASLRQHGYKTDETGRVIPLPYEEMSEQQQAIHDLKASQEELADANAAYAKAKKENIPTSMHMAQQRIDTANRNASSAAGRLGLAQANYNAHNLGTDVHGQALPGTVLGDDNKPIGSAFQANVKPTSTERTKADLASSSKEQIDTMKSIINKRPDVFGPLAGRKTDFTVWLGSQDPDAQQFRAARTIAADHAAGVFGARSASVIKTLDNALGQFKDNPQAALAGIKQFEQANDHFIGKGTPKVTGGNAAKEPTAEPATNDLMTVHAGGQTGQIHPSQVAEFLKKHPDAKDDKGNPLK